MGKNSRLLDKQWEIFLSPYISVERVCALAERCSLLISYGVYISILIDKESF